MFLAHTDFFLGYSIKQLAISVVIIAAVIALVWIALKRFGPPPPWVMEVFWVVIVTVVIIVAIHFVSSLW